MTKKLFVYGTLRKGYHNNQYLSGGKYLCSAYIKGYQMYIGYCVPVIIKKMGSIVKGEIWEFQDNVYKMILPFIDSLEGGYERIKEVAIDADYNVHEVEVYVVTESKSYYQEVATGDFNDR